MRNYSFLWEELGSTQVPTPPMKGGMILLIRVNNFSKYTLITCKVVYKGCT